MKMNELKLVNAAVETNVALFVSTKGENLIVGTQNFTPEMEKMFDSLYDYLVFQEIKKEPSILSKCNAKASFERA